jgi:hypothetical protein
MLVVAVAACGAWGVKLWRLAREYAALAQMHTDWDSTYRWLPEKPHWFAKSMVLKAYYHDAMARKWERAARYPWLPVEPDAPEPSVLDPRGTKHDRPRLAIVWLTAKAREVPERFDSDGEPEKGRSRVLDGDNCDSNISDLIRG